MSEQEEGQLPPTPNGGIAWRDLTVPNAEEIRDFYAAVVGWTPQNVEMGDYNDFVMMIPDSGAPAGGICHARGVNADLPPMWIPYIQVADLEASIAASLANGGSIISDRREHHFVVFRDPAGAVFALMGSS